MSRWITDLFSNSNFTFWNITIHNYGWVKDRPHIHSIAFAQQPHNAFLKTYTMGCDPPVLLLSGEVQSLQYGGEGLLDPDNGKLIQWGPVNRERGKSFHRQVLPKPAICRGRLWTAAKLQRHPVAKGHQRPADAEVQWYPAAVLQRGIGSRTRLYFQLVNPWLNLTIITGFGGLLIGVDYRITLIGEIYRPLRLSSCSRDYYG